MAAASMSAVYTEYLQSKMQTVLEAMVTSMLVDRPVDVEPYMVDWLSKWQKENNGGDGVAPASVGSEASAEQVKDDDDLKRLQSEKEALSRQKEELLQRLSSSLVASCDNDSLLPPEMANGGRGLTELEVNSPCNSPSNRPLSATNGSGVRCESAASMAASEVERQEAAMEEAKELEKVAQMKDKDRRPGVSAQAVSEERMKDWKKPFFEKTPEARERLKEIIGSSDKLQVLFGHLTDEAIHSVIDAMFSKEIGTNESIITQGEEGDNFYIVEQGQFDVFVQRGDAEPTKVLEVGPGACFGELALMYNAPRAATVTAKADATVWALDRESFQMMLVTAENTKKKQYEGFLEKVEILKDLNRYEMAQLSDMLESNLFDCGETIITQGDPGNYFYIIEDGEAKAYIGGEKGEIEVKHYKVNRDADGGNTEASETVGGEYFGEIALLTSATRKATIRAAGNGCSVLSVSREDFDRVLGPIKDILCKNIDKYPQYADFIHQEAEKEAAEDAEQKKISQMQEQQRRPGVSSQAVSAERMKEWVKPFFEKPEDARQKLKNIVCESDKLQVLFGHLTDESLFSVIDAMFPKEIAQGESIIKQGEEGDNFYIVEEGEFDVFIKRSEGDATKVMTISPGACFGELALMYNAPRAATVTATSASKCWALDRETFQMMLVTNENTKKKEYEGFLERVEILKDLTKYELAQLSDMLESELFDAGEAIITQGDAGNYFYIIEDGEARAYIAGDQGEIEVKQYCNPGDYFGEIALLTSSERKASVRAAGKGCAVLSVGRDDFDRVLGPIKDMLSRHVDQYPMYAQLLENAQGEAEALAAPGGI